MVEIWKGAAGLSSTLDLPLSFGRLFICKNFMYFAIVIDVLEALVEGRRNDGVIVEPSSSKEDV